MAFGRIPLNQEAEKAEGHLAFFDGDHWDIAINLLFFFATAIVFVAIIALLLEVTIPP